VIAAADRADMNIFTKKDKQKFIRFKASQFRLKELFSGEPGNKEKVLSFKTVIEEAIVADLLKTGRKDMEQEAADEFGAVKRNGF
jgi:hypothetical protein